MPIPPKKGKAAAKKTVEDTARRVVESGARVVGAVMQFQQLNGAASILKRIKELDPTIVTMVGGGHCMDIGGRTVLRHWDFVDYVFFGEADEIIGEVCEKILAGEKDFPLPYGVLRRGESHDMDRVEGAPTVGIDEREDVGPGSEGGLLFTGYSEPGARFCDVSLGIDGYRRPCRIQRAAGEDTKLLLAGNI